MSENVNVRVDVDAAAGSGIIELIHHIEKEVDVVMARNGFNRTGTSKYPKCTIIHYRQFGMCVDRGNGG